MPSNRLLHGLLQIQLRVTFLGACIEQYSMFFTHCGFIIQGTAVGMCTANPRYSTIYSGCIWPLNYQLVVSILQYRWKRREGWGDSSTYWRSRVFHVYVHVSMPVLFRKLVNSALYTAAIYLFFSACDVLGLVVRQLLAARGSMVTYFPALACWHACSWVQEAVDSINKATMGRLGAAHRR